MSPAAISRRWPWPADLALAAALGALFDLAFVHTGAWWLQLACLALVASRLRSVTPGRAAAIGAVFGAAWLVGGTWWLFISMHRYGGLPAPLAGAAVLALSLGLSTYLSLAFGLFARLRGGRVPGDALLFAAVWLAAELARALLFTGFPWVASGYGQIDGPLAALAPWVGVYGIGFMLALCAALLARGRPLPVLAALALLLAAPLARHDFSQPKGRLAVSLVQTNVAQDEKFAEERMPEALDWLGAALASSRGTLVMAPETAVPLLPDQLGADRWDALRAPFSTGARAALIGLPLGNFEDGYTNSAAGLSKATAALPGGFYRYDKHHLVPFGEFVPTGFRWFVELMNIPLGDFNRGPVVAPSFEVQGQRIAPNICYEDLFGEELAQRFTDDATAPTVMANLSNIGWFGDTVAIDQHLNITRMRSLELQRPMLRSTNTGATAVVDHAGRVTASLPRFTRGTLEAEVEGRSGLTPFARWAGRWQLWPMVLLAAATVLGTGLARRGKPRP